MDTTQTYGRISRALHWGLAMLILWQFLGMAVKLILGRVPLAGFFVGLHQPVGLAIFTLVGLRVLWALLNRGHRPGHGAGVVGLAARVGHLVLYALMVIVPLLALLRAYGNSRAFAPWGFEIFAPRAEEITWMVGLGNAAHGVLAWAFLVLIAGHVATALVHQIVLRDGTLRRMAR
ncbi:cytochrome b [Pseudooceanicola sediminis]|uniref:Cytochrome b n=2 Tax=Pseudooceanicola sediminis TaxID=2211117 RepID=A0A399J3A6_9RHOB|nr:cytochrome b [Puniceibacterium sp. HSS470]RII39804.1 cytochrome b [Pseudooceanicola sediminis]